MANSEYVNNNNILLFASIIGNNNNNNILNSAQTAESLRGILFRFPELKRLCRDVQRLRVDYHLKVLDSLQSDFNRE